MKKSIFLLSLFSVVLSFTATESSAKDHLARRSGTYMNSGYTTPVANNVYVPCTTKASCRSVGNELETRAAIEGNSYEASAFPKAGYKLAADGFYHKKLIGK